jgi:uncharacterized cupin superfamily protein
MPTINSNNQNINYKYIMPNRKLDLITWSYLDLIRFFLILFFAGVVFTLPLRIYGIHAAKERMKIILYKYYTEDEITTQNIYFVSVKPKLKLSNGVILSDEDYNFFFRDRTPVLLAVCSLISILALDVISGKKNLKFLYWYLNEIDKAIRIKTDCQKTKWQFASRYSEIMQKSNSDKNEIEASQGNPYISGNSEIHEGEQYKITFYANGAKISRWEIDWGDETSNIIEGNTEFTLHKFTNRKKKIYNVVIKAVEIIKSAEIYSDGFSVGYWKSHLDEWQIDSTRNYAIIFGVNNYVSVGSLFDVINCNDNSQDLYNCEIKQLWLESTAAILNATHSNVRYKYTLEEIIDIVQKAYQSGQYVMYAEIFKSENSQDEKNLTNNIKEPQEKIFNIQKTVKQL